MSFPRNPSLTKLASCLFDTCEASVGMSACGIIGTEKEQHHCLRERLISEASTVASFSAIALINVEVSTPSASCNDDDFTSDDEVDDWEELEASSTSFWLLEPPMAWKCHFQHEEDEDDDIIAVAPDGTARVVATGEHGALVAVAAAGIVQGETIPTASNPWDNDNDQGQDAVIAVTSEGLAFFAWCGKEGAGEAEDAPVIAVSTDGTARYVCLRA